LELTVGITELQPYWSIILNQIGVPYQEINIDAPINPGKYAALILSSSPNKNQIEHILQFLKEGGGVLTEANYSARLLKSDLKEATIKYLYSVSNDIFSNIPLCDLESNCEVSSDAGFLPNQDGIKTTAIRNYQKGQVVILPSNFCKSILYHETIIRKNFPAITKRFPSERISRVSTGSVRQIIQRALMHLFNSRQLPFVQLWFFPDGAKNIFAFRVDTDAASKSDIERLYQLCKKNDISATWFLDTKSHENWIDFFAKMEKQEISYHCYKHVIHADSYANHVDMEKGLSLLKKSGFKPRGYAAPMGEWDFRLGHLIQESGFEYSSEFGCAYDDLPFFPYLGTNFSTVLQVPIHPICTRTLFLARHNEEQMLEYYIRIMDQKLCLNEPIIFYDHPIHGHYGIFGQVFKEVNEREIPNTTLFDYQLWWRKRHSTQWQANYNDGNFEIHSSNGDPSIWIKVTQPDKQEFLMPIHNPEEQIPLKNLLPPAQNLFTYDPQKLRRRKLLALWRDIETYYGKLKQ